MHLIRLTNATFFAHHGVSTEEKHIGGRYEVDVEIRFDFEVAAQEDNLAQTVCYEMIYQIVQRVVQDRRYDLIERIAYLIANQLKEMSEEIEYVEVTVRKHNPPLKGIVDFAEVVYRSDQLKR